MAWISKRENSCFQYMKSFRRFHERREAGAKLLHQRGLVGFRSGKVAHLDVAKTAYLFRNGGEAYRDMMIVRREAAENLAEHRLIICDQLALGAALGGVAED